MKSTAIAPSNIAFIKYWGKKDEKLRLPENGSISMCLSNMTTTTTVEFDEKYERDLFHLVETRPALPAGKHAASLQQTDDVDASRVSSHLDRVRLIANISYKAKVVSKNSFPSGTGLSSSASGFAALTVAACSAAGLSLSEKELSIIARQGSGSACRSIPDGFVEWVDGDTSDDSFAQTLFSPEYWDISDVVAVVSTDKKDVSTSEGQKLVSTSPFFDVRKSHMNEKIRLCKTFLSEKNFTRLGELIESEALELHAIMLTSTPSLIYWTSGTLEIMKLTKKWRDSGLEVYFTINTGQDVHLIVRKKDIAALEKMLSALPHVQNIIVNEPCKGAHTISDHLF